MYVPLGVVSSTDEPTVTLVTDGQDKHTGRPKNTSARPVLWGVGAKREARAGREVGVGVG